MMHLYLKKSSTLRACIWNGLKPPLRRRMNISSGKWCDSFISGHIGELNQASENWSKPKDLCMSTIFVVSVGSLCPVKAQQDIVSRNPCYTPAVYSKSNEEVQNDLQRKHWCYNSGVWMPSCNTDWMKRTVKLLNHMGSCGCPPVISDH